MANHTVNKKSFLSNLPKPVKTMLKLGMMAACGSELIACTSTGNIGEHTWNGSISQQPTRVVNYCDRFRPSANEHPVAQFSRVTNLSYQRSDNYRCLTANQRKLVDHVKKTEFNCRAWNTEALVYRSNVPYSAQAEGRNENSEVRCDKITGNLERIHLQGYTPTFAEHSTGSYLDLKLGLGKSAIKLGTTGLPWGMDLQRKVVAQCGDNYTINYENRKSGKQAFTATCNATSNHRTGTSHSSQQSGMSLYKSLSAEYNMPWQHIKRYDFEVCKKHNQTVTISPTKNGGALLDCH